MAQEDRYEIVLEGTCIGKNIRNVFYYLQTNGDELAADSLGSEFRNEVVQAMRAICTVDTVYQTMFTKNLDNPDDFENFTFSPAQGGNVNAETLPPFVCWSFIYNRATLSSRNGWKRVAGVPETWQVDGLNEPTASQAALEACAEAFETPISAGVSDTFVPVIMRKTRQPEVGEFESFLYEEFPIASVSYKHIGSQNTRKF